MFDRPGRATMVLPHDAGDQWLVVHSHMSLNRGVPQASHGEPAREGAMNGRLPGLTKPPAPTPTAFGATFRCTDGKRKGVPWPDNNGAIEPRACAAAAGSTIRTIPAMTALYIERYMNYGITREELQGGKPIIGIAQTGSDLSPCNRHHIDLARRVRDGIRDAGGIPLEFPMHPIQETGKRPTAALDRNLAYLGLVEVLHGYPLDGVVLTTGCDKTTPACLMGAATVNIPAIVLSGGPMLDGWWQGRLSGSGTIVWEGRKLLCRGQDRLPRHSWRWWPPRRPRSATATPWAPRPR